MTALGAAVVLAKPLAAAEAQQATVPAFELDEVTVGQLQEGMRSARWSARSVMFHGVNFHWKRVSFGEPLIEHGWPGVDKGAIPSAGQWQC